MRLLMLCLAMICNRFTACVHCTISPHADNILTRGEHARTIPPELAERMREVDGQLVAPRTLATYDTAWRGFSSFCSRHGLTALPASEETMILFLASESRRLAMSTLRGYVSAV